MDAKRSAIETHSRSTFQPFGAVRLYAEDPTGSPHKHISDMELQVAVSVKLEWPFGLTHRGSSDCGIMG